MDSMDSMDSKKRQELRQDKLKKRLEEAHQDYSKHTIASRTENSWRLQRENGDCYMWTEVMVGHRGAVVVTGDGPDLILRSWRSTESSMERLNLLHWAGVSSISYLGSKVVAGPAREYDGEKALLDVMDELDSLLEGEEITKEQYDDLCPASDQYIDEDYAKTIWQTLYEITEDFERDEFGLVPSFDLVYAQAACARLSMLLSAELHAEKTA